MLKDGDRVLICLSGSSASLSLLHALRQFSRARGIQIDLGAVSLGSSGVDPRALMLYLRDLKVNYIFEQLSKRQYTPLDTHLIFYLCTSIPPRPVRQCSSQTTNHCPPVQLHRSGAGQHTGQAGRRLPGVGAKQRPFESDQSALCEPRRWPATDSSIHIRSRTNAGRFRNSTWTSRKAVEALFGAAECEQQHFEGARVVESRSVWQYQKCPEAVVVR